MTQNNLGAALRNQAARTSGPEAVQLLADAVKAYRAALEVFSDSEFAYQRGVVTRNLERAEAQLQKLGTEIR